jgi:hypothetical protein
MAVRCACPKDRMFRSISVAYCSHSRSSQNRMFSPWLGPDAAEPCVRWYDQALPTFGASRAACARPNSCPAKMLHLLSWMASANLPTRGSNGRDLENPGHSPLPDMKMCVAASGKVGPPISVG